MQRGPPVSSLITSRYLSDNLGCLVAEIPVIYICLYIDLCFYRCYAFKVS
jgi:hypothetical protein